MNELPQRKRNRIENFDYAACGAYFVTVCSANREKIFWQNVGADIIRPDDVTLTEIGEIVQCGILQITDHYPNVLVEKYCIMPDHVHLILRMEAGENGRMISAPTVSTVVGSLKRWVSRQVGRPIWQKSFYDHGIRGQDDFDEIWRYIENNPLKYIIKKAP